MKRWAILLIGLVWIGTALAQDALPYYRDIEDLELMRVMGIDQGTETEDSLRVTMIGGDQSTGKEGESQAPVILSQEASTLSKACAEMKSDGEKFICYGHITQCLVGEDAARSHLVQLLDYYERDTELRLNAPLFIIRGGTAGELLETGGEEADGTVIKRLESLEIDIRLQPDSCIKTVKDVLGELSENGCALVPALTLEAEETGSGEDEQSDQPPQKITTAGYGVFQDNRLTGFLTGEEATGANLLLDEIHDGILELTLSDGSRVAVELLDSSCDWKPSFDSDGTPTGLTAEIKAEGAITEIMGDANPMTEADLAEMEAAAAQRLQSMAEQTLLRAQTEGTDFLHLERKLGILRPDCWRQIQKTWETVFPSLESQVTVTMQLRRTYDVDRPLEEAQT